MIRDAYVMLAQEPWCYTPSEIGRMTDWQIEYLYARPAAERAEEFRRMSKGDPLPPKRPEKSNEPEPEPGTPEHRRRVMTAFMVGPFAMSREKAEKMYEHQLTQWRIREGK